MSLSGVHTPRRADMSTCTHVHIYMEGRGEQLGMLTPRATHSSPRPHGGGVINISGAFSSEGAEAGGGRGIYNA